MSPENPKPQQVRQAQHEGNHDALSAMARKSARTRAENMRREKEERDNQDALDAALAEEKLERAAAERIYDIDSEGDVIPPSTILPLGQ